MESIVAVIRSAGERTTNACYTLLVEQLAPSQVHPVREVPFEAALERCYQIGVASGAKWLLTLDADVLLQPDSVERLVLAAERMPKNFAQLEGRVFDKVLGKYRQAGHRLYRTSLLPLALRCLPRPGSQLRPEYSTLQEMGRRGHPSRRVGTVVGLHDFEQHYHDLYRKAFVHARKHKEMVAELICRCADRQSFDADFLVILKGCWDGLISSDAVSINVDALDVHASRAVEALGLNEKPAFDVTMMEVGREWIANNMEGQPSAMEHYDLPVTRHELTNRQRFKELSDNKGLLHAIRYSIGSCIERIGIALKESSGKTFTGLC